VLRAGETETAQENIRDWLELVGGDPISDSDRGGNCCSDIYIYTLLLFSSALPILLNFSFIYFLFFLLGLFSIINPNYRLIRMTHPINPD
jgi:hypothetical protein